MHKKYNDSHGSIQGDMEFKYLAMPPKAKALDSNNLSILKLKPKSDDSHIVLSVIIAFVFIEGLKQLLGLFVKGIMASF